MVFFSCVDWISPQVWDLSIWTKANNTQQVDCVVGRLHPLLVSFLYILVVGGGDGGGEVCCCIRYRHPPNVPQQHYMSKKKIEKEKFILAHHVSPACSTIISWKIWFSSIHYLSRRFIIIFPPNKNQKKKIKWKSRRECHFSKEERRE